MIANLPRDSLDRQALKMANSRAIDRSNHILPLVPVFGISARQLLEDQAPICHYCEFCKHRYPYGI
jgi:hypothetical protein